MGGRTGTQADEGSERTSGRTNGRAGRWTSERGRVRWADEQTGADNGWMGGRADRRTGGRTGGLADGRTTDFRR